MQFILCVIDNESGSAIEAEMDEIRAFNLRMKSNSQLVFACGIEPPSKSKLVDATSENATTRDGSYIDSEYYVSGLWIIDVADETVAQNLAAQASKCCNRRIELRKVL